ncbi:metallophosphoesterase [Maliponia aquimaris]|uniref:3',5'-cyclic adenosine monophosphate phosphodiesterase CpdA n=1 Tax=Maliponia aquimaris TaxID=1673631 RepID=A0A238K5N1_9RHOB|nr:metallophosphoesterase [Maliponia aquimaris]SMX38221.1 3',5'-cyclic adenosine monophosphate phosphodiesterase CpdA [Maliponia aquimaris]
MKFIHMSDIHLAAPGKLVDGIDPAPRLAQALAHIARHHADAARLIITGDLTHWAEPEAYAALKVALKGMPVPVRLMVGNHDTREGFLATFPDHPRDDAGHIQHAEDLPEGRFIYCDTIQPETHAGHFCEPRRAWLAKQLAGTQRAFVFFHHNVLHLGDPATDLLSLNDADQAPLRALLVANRDRIAHIFFGHVHEPLSGTLAGIPFSGVTSTVHQTIPNLSPSLMSGMGPLEPSYRVVLIRGEDVVIHQIPFAWEGEVIWHGGSWQDWVEKA